MITQQPALLYLDNIAPISSAFYGNCFLGNEHIRTFGSMPVLHFPATATDKDIAKDCRPPNYLLAVTEKVGPKCNMIS